MTSFVGQLLFALLNPRWINLVIGKIGKGPHEAKGESAR
jgi:hypothetical protein